MKIITVLIAIIAISCSSTKQHQYPKSPCKRKHSIKTKHSIQFVYNQKFLKTKGINIFLECENVI